MSASVRVAPSLLSADFARLGDEVTARHRGRRRPDPLRRDGQPLRAQPHRRPAGVPGDQRIARRHGADRRAPDGPAGRSRLIADVRAGRRRHHLASIPRPASTSTARLQLIRVVRLQAGLVLNPATPLHLPRPRDGPARPDPADVGQSGLRRSELHRGDLAEDRARCAAASMRRGRDIWLEVDGGVKADNAERIVQRGRRHAGRRLGDLQRRSLPAGDPRDPDASRGRSACAGDLAMKPAALDAAAMRRGEDGVARSTGAIDLSRIRAIAFDLDGTLVDSAPDIAARAELRAGRRRACAGSTSPRCAPGSATARRADRPRARRPGP